MTHPEEGPLVRRAELIHYRLFSTLCSNPQALPSPPLAPPCPQTALQKASGENRPRGLGNESYKEKKKHHKWHCLMK